MYEWIVNKDDREARLKEHKDQDVRAWLIIGAIAIVTLLAVWIPLILGVVHS